MAGLLIPIALYPLTSLLYSSLPSTFPGLQEPLSVLKSFRVKI